MRTSAQIARSMWIRIISFLVCYFLLIYLFSNVIQAITAAFFHETTSFYQFCTSVLFNSLISFVLVWLFRKIVDKESFNSLGFNWKGFGKERTAGFLTAVVLITCISTVLWYMNLLQWVLNDLIFQDFLLITMALILIAVTEELVFRGYILNNLLKSMPKQAALFLSALLFAVLHSLNPNFNFIAFINIFIAGLLLGVNYIFSRNLGFAVFFHFSWNFLQGPLLGYRVSGIELPALLFQNSKGSVLLTGGNFGLEASWLTTLLLSITVMLLYFIFQKKYNHIAVF